MISIPIESQSESTTSTSTPLPSTLSNPALKMNRTNDNPLPIISSSLSKSISAIPSLPTPMTTNDTLPTTIPAGDLSHLATSTTTSSSIINMKDLTAENSYTYTSNTLAASVLLPKTVTGSNVGGGIAGKVVVAGMKAGATPPLLKYCLTLYPFLAGRNDELTFDEGQIILIIRRVEGGWWEGKLDDRIGWFPSDFVTMNIDAERLATTIPQKNREQNLILDHKAKALLRYKNIVFNRRTQLNIPSSSSSTNTKYKESNNIVSSSSLTTSEDQFDHLDDENNLESQPQSQSQQQYIPLQPTSEIEINENDFLRDLMTKDLIHSEKSYIKYLTEFTNVTNDNIFLLLQF